MAFIIKPLVTEKMTKITDKHVIGSARKADMGIEATAEAYAAAMKV